MTSTTVIKAYRILEYLSINGPSPLQQIMEALDLPKATVYRLAETLVELEVLQKVGPQYRANWQKKRPLHHPIMNSWRSFDIMQKFVNQFNLPIYVGVLDDDEVLIVQVVPRSQHPDDSTKLGERLPVNISAMGKCLIAFGKDPLPELSQQCGTSYAIREEALLKQNLAVIRHKGYALDDEENVIGLRCLAVPICVQNQAVACLGTSAPIKNLSRRKISQIVNSLKTYSRQLSNIMMEE
ncbi:IclR family transcriptional regulator [Limosilactobacillus mucosae]